MAENSLSKDDLVKTEEILAVLDSLEPKIEYKVNREQSGTCQQEMKYTIE